MVDKPKFAVYNCKSCGRMVLGLYGPKNPSGKACPTCFGKFERNDVATMMMKGVQKDD